MKVNEKNLCAFAVSSTYLADKEGYLMKKGDVHKGFQKRWFVLKGNLLFYFEKRNDREPLGVIILEGCTIELDETDAQFSFKLVFHGMGNRSYVLCAESQETMEQWMKSLACASYDYMKLMVTDLQRQLKETKTNKVSEKINDPSAVLTTDDADLQPLNTTKEGNGYPNISPENTSPYPPPRQRHLNHRAQGSSQSPNLQPNLSRSKTNPMSLSDATMSHSIPSSRNKILFKCLHTMYGRPVLRDRNEWRYNKLSDENPNSTSTSLIDFESPVNRQQNFLISL